MPELVVPSAPALLTPSSSLYRETYILDPLSEEPDDLPLLLSGRDPGHPIHLTSIKFPEPERTTTRVGGRDVEGDLVVGYPTHRNRIIPVEVLVAEPLGVDTFMNHLDSPDPSVAPDGGPLTWQGVGAGAVTSSTAHHRTGETSLRVDTEGGDDGAHSPTFGSFSAQFVYAVAWVWIPTGAHVWITLDERDIVGASDTSANLTHGDETIGAGDWALLSVSHLVGTPASGHTTAMRVRVTCTQGAPTFFIDQVTVVKDADPVFPFDGNTPGATWTGTPYASTSVRAGSGSDRIRFEKALYQLEEKLMKIDRYGGTMKRYLMDDTWGVFDLLGATLTGDNWTPREFSQGRSLVSFDLEAKPYMRLRKQETAITDPSTGGQPVKVSMIVPGDVPALGRLVIREVASVDRHLLVTGGRARTYDPDAPLLYEAEDLQIEAGASAGHVTDDSGSSVGITTGGPTFFQPLVTLAGIPHIGTYRVIARVRNAAFGFPIWALTYSQGEDYALNGTKALAMPGDVWCPIDLGLVDLAENPLISPTKSWITIGFSTNIVAEARIDSVALIPCEFGNVEISTPDDEAPAIHAGQSTEIRYDGVQREFSDGSSWGPLTKGFSGDRLLVPPSGKAQRPVEMAAFATFAPFGRTDGAPWFTAITAQLVVIPRVIHVPDPT